MNITSWEKDPLLKHEKKAYITEIRDGNRRFVNLYRTLVRPEKDFISRDSLQIKTPYLVGKNLVDYITDLLQGKFGNIDRGLLEATRGMEKYAGMRYFKISKAKYRYKQTLKKKRINMVFARVISLIVSDNMDESVSIFNKFLDKTKHFSGKTDSFVKIPLDLSYLMDNRIVYLSGVIAGDGHLGEKKGELKICDGHKRKRFLKDSKTFTCYIGRLIKDVFELDSKIIRERNLYLLIVYNKWLCRILNYFFDIDFGEKYNSIRLPKIVKCHPHKEGLFWRGLFDTDGSIKKEAKGLRLKSSSKTLISDLHKFCSKNGISPIVYRAGAGIDFVINSSDYLKYLKCIGFSHPRKRRVFESHLNEGPKYLVFNGIDKPKMTKTGYYDYSSNISFCVYGMGEYIREIRHKLNLSLSDLGKKIGKEKKTIWRYEHEEMPTPVKYLVKIGNLAGFSKDKVYMMLESKGVLFCVPRSKNRINLPLAPNTEFLNILKSLRFYDSGSVYIRMSENLGNIRNEEIQRKLENIENIFGLKPIGLKKANRKHKQYYICSKVLNLFLKEFHLYELPWEPQGNEEIEKLRNRWSYSLT